MPRIAALKPGEVPADSKLTLDAFTKNLGFTPNMMATFAASPIAFNAWATLRTSLSKALDLKTRESISLAVSEVNGCNYCLAVHTFGAGHAKMSADEIILARKGHANDPKRDAAVQFARKVIETRGQVSDVDVKAVRTPATWMRTSYRSSRRWPMYSLTNFFNVFDPENDFPAVPQAGSI
jgi:AhpD family alkylhydroperoxidase